MTFYFFTPLCPNKVIWRHSRWPNIVHIENLTTDLGFPSQITLECKFLCFYHKHISRNWFFLPFLPPLCPNKVIWCHTRWPNIVYIENLTTYSSSPSKNTLECKFLCFYHKHISINWFFTLLTDTASYKKNGLTLTREVLVLFLTFFKIFFWNLIFITKDNF